MSKPFNLSEKINDDYRPIILVSDVKEFIRRENDLLKKLQKEEIDWIEFAIKRSKLVGDKLVEDKKK